MPECCGDRDDAELFTSVHDPRTTIFRAYLGAQGFLAAQGFFAAHGFFAAQGFLAAHGLADAGLAEHGLADLGLHGPQAAPAGA